MPPLMKDSIQKPSPPAICRQTQGRYRPCHAEKRVIDVKSTLNRALLVADTPRSSGLGIGDAMSNALAGKLKP